jgi:uncharacterized protein YjbJ (UPF0337 family)
MDKDRIAGMVREFTGSLKKIIGNITGDARLQAEGTAEKIVGKVQSTVGGVKDAVRDTLKK